MQYRIQGQSPSRNLVRSALLVLTMSVPVTAWAGDYQHNALFSPSDSQIEAEARGRIMIYDGLTNETVERALDHQFDRIGNMMFVRTIYIQENGEYEVDDDCD